MRSDRCHLKFCRATLKILGLPYTTETRMDSQRAKISAEVAWVRLRGALSLAIQLIGIAIVLLAVFNAYGTMLTEYGAYAPYRPLLIDTLGLGLFGPFAADHIVLGVGLILAYWG